MDSRRRSFLDDDGGRQHPPPRRHFRVRKGRFDLLVGMGGDPQGTKHLDQRGGRNVVLQPIPAMERRPDAVSIREPVEQVLVNGGLVAGGIAVVSVACWMGVLVMSASSAM
ncbi:hypothetical protein AHiyo8_32810 [Arthrobacter sp. Hiyo8]|nr:hypothetical protein AHiyo8_32810 [Arthrobacter sp. Hiyo8]